MAIGNLYINQIKILCDRFKVKRLSSFGSVNSTKFNEQSDIDFLVDFNVEDPLEYTENYFNLKFGLEEIFKKHIDLLENKALKNPFLKESIKKSEVLIYGQ